MIQPARSAESPPANVNLLQPGSGVILLVSPAYMPAQKRGVALAIGNTAYPNDQLKNAVADAQDVATAFKNLGFDVTLKPDLGLTDFNTAIQTFRQAALADQGIAVFYFSGHGIQVNGQSYLIPGNQ